jgi:CheY-like chemotaxis protein
MRVLVASEKDGLSRLLEVVEEGGDRAEVVGQADNVNKALALAKQLRPDLAIIDASLPYSVGLRNVPLTGVGGLDAAQMISQEIPDARVMIVNNLESLKLPEDGLGGDTHVSFAEERLGPTFTLNLRELSRNRPVFARVQLAKRPWVKARPTHYSDEIILFGGVGILLGLIMMVTLILFVPGLVLAGLGAVAALAGFGLKRTRTWWGKKA